MRVHLYIYQVQCRSWEYTYTSLRYSADHESTPIHLSGTVQFMRVHLYIYQVQYSSWEYTYISIRYSAVHGSTPIYLLGKVHSWEYTYISIKYSTVHESTPIYQVQTVNENTLIYSKNYNVKVAISEVYVFFMLQCTVSGL